MRNAIPPTMHAARSQRAAKRLIGCPQWNQADTVLTYAPIGSELNVFPLIEAGLQAGKRIVLPCVDGDELRLYTIRDPHTDLRPAGRYQIPEPDPARCQPLEPFWDFDLAILPGLGFDPRGGRIGYGKAYFDRLLSRVLTKCGSKRPDTIGIAFETQLTSCLPMDNTDVRLDYIVTENSIYRFQISRGNTCSVQETKALGHRLGEAIQTSTVFLFEGPLAAGKTTCIQGLTAALGIDTQAASPTFVYERRYTAARSGLDGLEVHHLDLYRLPVPDTETNPDTGLAHDLADLLETPGITLIEWPDRLGLQTPIDAVWLHLYEPNEDAGNESGMRHWILETVTEQTAHLHNALLHCK